MPNTSSDDLSNHNLAKPIIRTMENDLRSLKNNLVMPERPEKNSAFPPKNLPIDVSRPISAPISPRSQTGGSFVLRSQVPKPAGKPEFFTKPKPVEELAKTSSAAPPAVFVAANMPRKPLEKKTEKIPEPFSRLPGEENLPPAARLAAQSFSSDLDFEKTPKGDNSRSSRDASRLDRYEIVSGQKKTFAGSSFGKALKYIIAIIVLAAVSGGIYYFLVLKKTFSSPESPGESLVAGADELVLQTNLDSPVAAEIKKYFSVGGGKDATVSNPAGVYRVIIQSNDGTKVLKEENFKNSLNLDFPAAVVNALDKNYNLLAFYYPQRNYLRLGMVFKIKDERALSEELARWEPSMLSNLEPLFLDNLALGGALAGFRSNAYNGANIRYFPLGLSDAALNYAVDKNDEFLLIAASREDIFYLINAVSR